MRHPLCSARFRILKEMAPLFASGALAPPVIVERFPLSEVVAAYTRVASGKGGKMVFDMSKS